MKKERWISAASMAPLLTPMIFAIGLPIALADPVAATSSIYLQILESPTFLVPQGFVSTTPQAGGQSGTPTGSLATSTSVVEDGNGRLSTRQFYIGDEDVQQWFFEQLVQNGQTDFAMCVPGGEASHLSILDTDNGTSSLVAAVEGQSAAMIISVNPDGTGSAGASCRGGKSSNVAISMVSATASGVTGSTEADSANTQVIDVTRIDLVITPE